MGGFVLRVLFLNDLINSIASCTSPHSFQSSVFLKHISASPPIYWTLMPLGDQVLAHPFAQLSITAIFCNILYMGWRLALELSISGFLLSMAVMKSL